MREKVLQFVREQGLLRAGDRVAVAVSGGADSVALLRVLLELKAELGLVLSVAHFNHQLRGEQSDADEAFVAELAKENGLEIFLGHGDVREHATASKVSIEAAGRQLRYRWFADLARDLRLDAVATAHTQDDQAETVLLKFLRGAGTRGQGGIYPVLRLQEDGGVAPASEGRRLGPPRCIPVYTEAELKAAADDRLGHSVRPRIIRPLLNVMRHNIEMYLTSLGQTWREDESNLDRRYLRNRLRHDLLPLLEREFNPNIREALSDLADISRGEEEFWQGAMGPGFRDRVSWRPSESEHSEADANQFARLTIRQFGALMLAIQRRFLKAFAEVNELALDFDHIERLRHCALGEVSRVELPGGILASTDEFGLTLRRVEAKPDTPYSNILPVPGELKIPEAGLCLRAIVVAPEFAAEAAPGSLLNLDLVGPQLTVRNWLPGDRFWPAHSRSEEKLKRLFLEKKIPAGNRPGWPVALCGDRIVWVRGFPVATTHQWRGAGEALQIEVLDGEPGGSDSDGLS